jgi:5'-deoxynucleotidase YfbR-like HD superfamily hydrolase
MISQLFKAAIDTATVTRYSNSKLIRDESVMEHIGSVSFMCLILGRHVRKAGYYIDMEELLTRSLLHDIEESRIGDISNPTKYHNDKLKTCLDDLAYDSMGIVLERMDSLDLLPHWINQKDQSLEGRLLKFCDVLSVLMKIYEEVIIYHNYSLIKHAKNTIKYFKNRLEFEDNPVLRTYIEEAIMINNQAIERDV